MFFADDKTVTGKNTFENKRKWHPVIPCKISIEKGLAEDNPLAHQQRSQKVDLGDGVQFGLDPGVCSRLKAPAAIFVATKTFKPARRKKRGRPASYLVHP